MSEQKPSAGSSATAAVASQPAPTTESVLDLLDAEIENITSSQTRGGWTMWAVLAALAAATWLLSEEIKSGPIQWDHVAVILVAGSILLDLIRFLAIVLNPQQAEDEPIPRFYWSHKHFSARRLFGLFDLARITLVVVLAFLSAAFTWKFLASLVMGYAVFFFMMAIVVVMSFSRWAFANQSNKFTYIFWGLILFGLGLAGILSLFVLPPINMGNIGSYRVAGLILATVYLLLFLSTMVTTSPVLQFLMHLRRDLVFGTKSLPKVINEADSALGGLRVTDALRDDYIAIILGIEELNEFTKNAEMTVSSIEQNIPNQEDDSTVADLKSQLVQTLLHAYQTWINDRIVRVQNVGKLIETSRKNARRILKTMYSAYPIVNQADSYINDAIQIADKKYNEMFDHYNETVKKLNLDKPKN